MISGTRGGNNNNNRGRRDSNMMKRLSKSATDLSASCRRKSHSTSPEEEEASSRFGEEEDDEEDDEDEVRPRSSASVGAPFYAVAANGRPSRGLISYLRERFSSSRSQSSERGSSVSPKRIAQRFNRPLAAGPHCRKAERYQQQSGVMGGEGGTGEPRAEIVRYQRTAAGGGGGGGGPSLNLKGPPQSEPGAHGANININNNNNVDVNTTTTRAEVVRHHVTPLTSLPAALAQELHEQQAKLKRNTVVMTSEETAKKKEAKRQETLQEKRHHLAHQKSVNGPSPPESLDKALPPTMPSTSPVTATGVTAQASVASDGDDDAAHLAALRQHAYYLLHVHLRRGYDLVARDANGSSDPYVKFLLRGKVQHKSRIVSKDLNPIWDEQFVLGIEDPFQPLDIKVFDYDWAFRDDFMGEASISLVRLELDKSHELLVSLSDPSSKSGPGQEYLGQVEIALRLEPKKVSDRRSSVVSALSHSEKQTVSSSSRHNSKEGSGSFGRDSAMASAGIASSSSSAAPANASAARPKNWSAVLNVVLIEAHDLLAMDFEGTSDPYCKFRLGNERYKSKPIFETLNPRWLEQFDLYAYADQAKELEITVWDKDQRSKDDFMGRCSVDVTSLQPDSTRDVWLDLQEGAGRLHLLLTLSGFSDATAAHPDGRGPAPDGSDLVAFQHPDRPRRIRDLHWRKSFADLNDIGHLEVKVYAARGLLAADLGGKSDPYAVLELDNARLQTHTEYKTINPVWNRHFVFPVKDFHSTLFITVYDDDQKHTFEFLGKLAVSLLRIESGKKRWFALKDKKLRGRAKGANPQILLEFFFVYNSVRGAVRTVNPKEERYMRSAEKFKRQVFLRNVMRIKAIVMEFVALGKFVESCLEWEHPIRSAIAFAAFMTIVYFAEPYMAPVALLLVFLKNYVIRSYLDPRGGGHHHHHAAWEEQPHLDGLDEDDDEHEEEKEEKKTLKARLQAIQEVTAMVQNAIGAVASLGESVKNTFNFSVPFLSWLAIAVLSAAAVLLYYVSPRYLLMAWGLNKFTKKLLRPNFVNNNEVLDFLSRVPDDEELLSLRELRLCADDELSGGTGSPKRKDAKQKKKQ